MEEAGQWPTFASLRVKKSGNGVGDLHQLLHVMTNSDLCSGKLNSTWDTRLVETASSTDVADAVDELEDAITLEMITKKASDLVNSQTNHLTSRRRSRPVIA